MRAILEVCQLRKRFGDLSVLRDVSFRLTSGESVAVLGPSGCGKTTLLRILLGLETFDEGEIRGTLDRAGYLPQGVLLFPWKTALENAELPLHIQRMDRTKRRKEVTTRLPSFGLAGFEHAYPHELSGGMQQRVGLLRAVVTGAPVLVLDEPFGALDTLTRHRLQNWLAGLRVELNRTMLFVTHDLEEAVVLSDRVIVLTERPATVLGEQTIALGPQDRADRLSPAFVRAKDALLAIVCKGERDVSEKSV